MEHGPPRVFGFVSRDVESVRVSRVDDGEYRSRRSVRRPRDVVGMLCA